MRAEVDAATAAAAAGAGAASLVEYVCIPLNSCTLAFGMVIAIISIRKTTTSGKQNITDLHTSGGIRLSQDRYQCQFAIVASHCRIAYS